MKASSELVGVLHLLLSANAAVWQDCVQCCKATDTVVLMDAGVMGLTGAGGNLVRDFPCPVAVSAPDYEARIGQRSNQDDDLDLVADGEIVRLLETHPHCLSWR